MAERPALAHGGDVGIARPIAGFGKFRQRVERGGRGVRQRVGQRAAPHAARDYLGHRRVFCRLPGGIEIKRGARLMPAGGDAPQVVMEQARRLAVAGLVRCKLRLVERRI